MYCEHFKPQNWRKRSGEARRRNCAVLPLFKRFGGLDEEGYAILEYQNEEAYPGKIIRVRDLIVQGVVKHVIRSL